MRSRMLGASAADAAAGPAPRVGRRPGGPRAARSESVGGTLRVHRPLVWAADGSVLFVSGAGGGVVDPATAVVLWRPGERTGVSRHPLSAHRAVRVAAQGPGSPSVTEVAVPKERIAASERVTARL